MFSQSLQRKHISFKMGNDERLAFQLSVQGKMKQDPYIERFLDKLWAERGLSDNSLQGYRHDLLHLSERLKKRGKNLENASREDLLAVLADSKDMVCRATSPAAKPATSEGETGGGLESWREERRETKGGWEGEGASG